MDTIEISSKVREVLAASRLAPFAEPRTLSGLRAIGPTCYASHKRGAPPAAGELWRGYNFRAHSCNSCL